MRYQLFTCSLVLSGCAVDAHSTNESAVESANALTANQLSANGISLNGISLNKLASNGISLNGISLNKLATNGISLNGINLDGVSRAYAAGGPLATWLQTEHGRHVFTYLARCALAPETMILTSVDGTTHAFRGSIGIWPKWATEPLSEEGRGWMSACMLAHVNAFGVSVPISIRGELGVLKAGQGEGEAFPFQEAAFFGDLFSPTPRMHGCLGWDGRGVYGDSSSYLNDRACVNGVAEGETSACGFVNVGACEVACENHNRTGTGPFDEVWEDCHAGSKDSKYPFVVTVYLP
jgi:hypothetical protein